MMRAATTGAVWRHTRASKATSSSTRGGPSTATCPRGPSWSLLGRAFLGKALGAPEREDGIDICDAILRGEPAGNHITALLDKARAGEMDESEQRQFLQLFEDLANGRVRDHVEVGRCYAALCDCANRLVQAALTPKIKLSRLKNDGGFKGPKGWWEMVRKESKLEAAKIDRANEVSLSVKPSRENPDNEREARWRALQTAFARVLFKWVSPQEELAVPSAIPPALFSKLYDAAIEIGWTVSPPPLPLPLPRSIVRPPLRPCMHMCARVLVAAQSAAQSRLMLCQK